MKQKITLALAQISSQRENKKENRKKIEELTIRAKQEKTTHSPQQHDCRSEKQRPDCRHRRQEYGKLGRNVGGD